ncbi:MAG: RidA family protein [Chloroflexi bacterium]|nr:RidA family protein [Chloroflexota bacterium]
MERKVINPWKWQDEFAFVQANEVRGEQRTLICAGQAAVDADGRPQHAGDMRAQINLALDNLETVLRAAGMNLSNVVRLNYYTTDVDSFFQNYDVVAGRLLGAGCQSAGSLIGVARLAFPELLVEFEATAVA